MPYLTQAWLEELYGTEKVAALCPGGATQIARSIDAAEAETETVLMNAGYPAAVPSSSYSALPAAGAQPASGECPRAITLLAFGAWLELRHGVMGIELPEQFVEYVRKLDLVRTGKMELPGLTKKGVDKDVARTIGGASFTDSSETTETGRPAVFNREQFRKAGW